MAYHLFNVKIIHEINKQNIPSPSKSYISEISITPNRVLLLINNINIKQIDNLVFY